MFRRFSSIEQAHEQLLPLLENENIFYKVEEEHHLPAVAMTGETRSPTEQYLVKIKPADFLRAETALQTQAAQAVSETDSEHYLFDFSSEELLDVVRKADEWSAFDVALAKKILQDQHVVTSEEQLIRLKQERLHELAKPETPAQGWIIFFYISSILGGLAGLTAGWHYWKSKKRLPDNRQIYMYDELTRDKGKIMMWVGLFFFLLTLVIQFTDFLIVED